MDKSFSWNSSDADFIICMLTLGIGFISYYFVTSSQSLKEFLISKFGAAKSNIYFVLFKRFWGVFLFGIIPIILIFLNKQFTLSQYGIPIKVDYESWVWILSLTPIILLMNYFNAHKPDNLAQYPEIRTTEWTFQLLFISASTWILYLIAYEFLFRGYVLFTSVRYLSIWAAIALNATLYALVHIPKGKKEAIGAIPLGILLGYITLKTENITAAIIIHVIMALSNEWFSIWAQPKMSLKKN